MSENISSHTANATPPRSNLQGKLLPILAKVKSVYMIWFEYYQIIPKTHRYSLGIKIDNLFLEIIENISAAAFSQKDEKLKFVKTSIKKLDTLKIFLMILWETKSLDNKKYINISEKIDEVGKMLGGWHGQIIKQNSPAFAGEK